MVRLALLVAALFLSNGCFAQQGSAFANSVCGYVSRYDTHRAVGFAWISIYSVAADKVHTSSLPPQQAAADGSFCFRSLPSGEYLLLPHKAGFVPASVNAKGALLLSITIPSGQIPQPLRLNLVPVPAVSQVPDGAFRAMYTPEQRRGLEFFVGAFSPSGRYLAFEIMDVNTGDPEQVWRYDPVTHGLLAVSAKPTAPADPGVDDIAWDGEVLYAKLHDYGPHPFLKTEGDATTAIPSWPHDLDVLNTATPRSVGPYLIDEGMMHGHGGGSQLLLGSKEIADMNVDAIWGSVENPPQVVVVDTRYEGIVIIDLRTLNRRVVRLPASAENIVAAWRAPKGIRVAYAVIGPCEPAEGLDPLIVPGNDNNQPRAHNLCLVDVPDRP